MNIKAIKFSNKKFNVEGILDEKNRVLILYKDTLKNLKNILNFSYNLNYYSVELIGTNGKRAIIHNIYSFYEYEKFFTYNVSLIVLNYKNLYEIKNIKEITAKIMPNPNKYFNLTGKSITFCFEKVGKISINNKYIKISNTNFKESEANFWIMKIMEFISIMIGEFPKIEYFRIKRKSGEIVEKYFNVDGITNTDPFFSFNNKKIVDFNEMNGKSMKKAFVEYCKLIEDDDIQLRTYFLSQSSAGHFSDYILTYLLQAIEGFSKFAFINELREYSIRINTKKNCEEKEGKEVDEKKIEEESKKYTEALEKVKEYIDNNFDENILDRLEGWFNHNNNNISFDNILNYWLDKDKDVMQIFKTEIEEDISSNRINKDKLVKISANERNRISHSMKRSHKKEYFSHEDRVLYVKKYTLMFRCIVLKKIGIRVNELPPITK